MKTKSLAGVVAILTGAAAAYLFVSSQQGGGTQRVEVRTRPLYVAKVELAKDTKLDKEKFDELVKVELKEEKDFPQDAVLTYEELVDKRVTKVVKPDEYFRPVDLTKNLTVEIPPGKVMGSLNTDRTRLVAGFAVPGSRVDVVATFRLTKAPNQPITFPLLRDVLVLAVDTNARGPENQGAVPNVTDVSLALDPKELIQLRQASSRGADMHMVLHSSEQRSKYPEEYLLSEEKIKEVLNDTYDPAAGKTGTGSGDVTQARKPFEAVEMPVPTEDLAAGTRLTDAVLGKFGTIAIQPPAPANMVLDMRKQAGKYLVKPLSAFQFVPAAAVADQPPADGADQLASKGRPQDEGASEKNGPTDGPVVVKPLPKYWDVMMQSASGTRRVRFEVVEKGGKPTYKYLGELPAAKPDADPADDGDNKDKPAPKVAGR